MKRSKEEDIKNLQYLKNREMCRLYVMRKMYPVREDQPRWEIHNKEATKASELGEEGRHEPQPVPRRQLGSSQVVKETNQCARKISQEVCEAISQKQRTDQVRTDCKADGLSCIPEITLGSVGIPHRAKDTQCNRWCMATQRHEPVTHQRNAVSTKVIIEIINHRS